MRFQNILATALFSAPICLLAASTGDFWIDAGKLTTAAPAAEAYVAVCTQKQPEQAAVLSKAFEGWKLRNKTNLQAVERAVTARLAKETKTQAEYLDEYVKLKAAGASVASTGRQRLESMQNDQLQAICSGLANHLSEAASDLSVKYPDEMELMRNEK